MERADIAILERLQQDSSLSLAELSQQLSMSSSACHRRIKALEARGVIAGYGARISAAHVGLGLQAFVEISLTAQSRESMDRFEAAVATFDDIIECHLMSGSADYIVRVAAMDLADFDQIHRNCLSRLPGVSAMRSSFSIRTIKGWRGYPLHRARD